MMLKLETETLPADRPARAGADGRRVRGTPGERVDLDPLLAIGLGVASPSTPGSSILRVSIERHGSINSSAELELVEPNERC